MWIALVILGLVGSVLLLVRGPWARESVSSSSLRRAVSVDGIVEHLEAFAEVARDNGGNRFTGTRGYERSVDYVVQRLEDAGLDIERVPFPFHSFRQERDTVLAIDGGRRFDDGVDMNAMLFSASDSVRAPLQALDFDRDGGPGPACERGRLSDEELQGAIVLVRPGPCLYRDQVRNLSAEGAAAVLFAAPDVGEGRLFRPTLFRPEGIHIPALVVTNDAGVALAGSEGETVEIEVLATVRREEADSVIAETPGGDGGEIVMIGGHLDSVLDGPGINDNGSGVGSILEIAEQLAERPVDKKVRFAFWGGEELGLLGSSAYVRSLSPDEAAAIRAYLNFDMVGSPNFVRFVYAPDGAPAGSAGLAALLTDYFDSQGLVTAPLDLEGRSDHGPFIEAGVPVGGLFTGAEDPKTEQEAALFGGEVGVPHDHCYHQACDTLENVDRTSLDQMSDAMAHAVAVLAGAS